MNVSELKSIFRITEAGYLERFYHGKYWRLVKNRDNTNLGYCRVRLRNGLNPIQYHRIIYILTTGKEIPDGYEIDHINGDKLDNRFQNLRLVTHRENTINKKRHRDGRLPGTYFNKKQGKWHARFWIKGRNYYLGSFDTEHDAGKAYLTALKEVQS